MLALLRGADADGLRHSPGEPDSYGEHNDAPLFQLLSRQSHGPLGLAIRDNDEKLGHSTIPASREPSVQAFQGKACLRAPASEETQGGSEGGSWGGAQRQRGSCWEEEQRFLVEAQRCISTIQTKERLTGPAAGQDS